MTTKQPLWKFTANLGDANPLNNGALLFVDATGVYAPELFLWDESYAKKRSVSRISCEQCTMLNNEETTLSDNSFHADKPAWFAAKINAVAGCSGIEVKELAQQLCASDPVKRATGYMTLISYFGVFEFDQYPREMTDAEIRRQYRAAFARKAVLV